MRAEPIVAVNGTLPSIEGAVRLVEVRHQGDLLGALSVTKRSGESLTPVEENLLSHLAGQAGLVLKNVGLTGDLQARLVELRASRQRLVSAQDEERRRAGAQPPRRRPAAPGRDQGEAGAGGDAR